MTGNWPLFALLSLFLFAVPAARYSHTIIRSFSLPSLEYSLISPPRSRVSTDCLRSARAALCKVRGGRHDTPILKATPEDHMEVRLEREPQKLRNGPDVVMAEGREARTLLDPDTLGEAGDTLRALRVSPLYLLYCTRKTQDSNVCWEELRGFGCFLRGFVRERMIWLPEGAENCLCLVWEEGYRYHLLE